jgi:hypothetical protein
VESNHLKSAKNGVKINFWKVVMVTRRRPTLTRTQAERRLSKHFNRIGRACVNGLAKYKDYPRRTVHRKTTKANVVCDEILACVVSEFDEVPGTKLLEDKKSGLRVFAIGEEIGLWFKKIDAKRRIKNIPTKHAQALHAGVQLELFSRRTILVVGYLPSEDGKRVRRISIFKPGVRRLDWFIDLEPPAEIQQLPIDRRKRAGLKFIVKQTEQKGLLGE